MTPIFIAIALTSPLKTKLVNSTAYLTSPLGCLPCISNLTYFNQNSWFLFLLQTGLSTKFPLLNKCYQHLLSFLGQILLLSLIPLFSTQSSANPLGYTFRIYIELDHLSIPSLVQPLFEQQCIIYFLNYFNSFAPDLHVSTLNVLHFISHEASRMNLSIQSYHGTDLLKTSCTFP